MVPRCHDRHILDPHLSAQVVGQRMFFVSRGSQSCAILDVQMSYSWTIGPLNAVEKALLGTRGLLVTKPLNLQALSSDSAGQTSL